MTNCIGLMTVLERSSQEEAIAMVRVGIDPASPNAQLKNEFRWCHLIAFHRAVQRVEPDASRS
jgi:hypothetical protein